MFKLHLLLRAKRLGKLAVFVRDFWGHTHQLPTPTPRLFTVYVVHVPMRVPPFCCSSLDWYNTGKVLPALLLLGWFGSVPAYLF